MLHCIFSLIHIIGIVLEELLMKIYMKSKNKACWMIFFFYESDHFLVCREPKIHKCMSWTPEMGLIILKGFMHLKYVKINNISAQYPHVHLKKLIPRIENHQIFFVVYRWTISVVINLLQYFLVIMKQLFKSYNEHSTAGSTVSVSYQFQTVDGGWWSRQWTILLISVLENDIALGLIW